MRSLCVAVSLIATVVVVACTSDKPALPGCLQAGVGPGAVPGVVVQGPGIDLQVRDPFGRGQAIGTTATVTRSDGFMAGVDVQDTLNILAVYGTEGTFTVTLTRPYYADVSVYPIAVSFGSDGCVNVKKIPVTLQLAANAPPVRAITILGADFLDHAGAQVQLVPHFDANPGVSTAVAWQVSDTTLATVDANGLVTAKCSKSGGTVKVTVTSVADPTVTSSVNMGVAPTASCS